MKGTTASQCGDGAPKLPSQAWVVHVKMHSHCSMTALGSQCGQADGYGGVAFPGQRRCHENYPGRAIVQLRR